MRELGLLLDDAEFIREAISRLGSCLENEPNNPELLEALANTEVQLCVLAAISVDAEPKALTGELVATLETAKERLLQAADKFENPQQRTDSLMRSAQLLLDLENVFTEEDSLNALPTSISLFDQVLSESADYLPARAGSALAKLATGCVLMNLPEDDKLVSKLGLSARTLLEEGIIPL